MTTSIYSGRVYHARTKCVSSPIEHAFSYPVWMALIDLKQVEEQPESLHPSPSILVSFAQQKQGWWSIPALARWKREDHFGENKLLSKDVKKLVCERTGMAEDLIDRIELLTNLSFFGKFNFNPVSVYYCYSKLSKLVAAVLEVSNTPWLDKRLYVLHFDKEASDGNQSYRMCWEKDFHVSPFMDGSHYYDWIIKPVENDSLRIEAISKRRAKETEIVPWQGPHLSGDAPTTVVDLESIQDLPTSFIVKLDLKRVSWDKVSRTILTNPVMPLAAVLWIHIEAFKVWYRGVAYITPPSGSRPLDLKDALKHLIVFIFAAVVRYGIILPVDMLRRLIRSILSRPASS